MAVNFTETAMQLFIITVMPTFDRFVFFFTTGRGMDRPLF